LERPHILPLTTPELRALGEVLREVLAGLPEASERRRVLGPLESRLRLAAGELRLAH